MRKAKKTDETVIAEATAVETKEASAVAPAGGETARIKEFLENVLAKMGLENCSVEATDRKSVV